MPRPRRMALPRQPAHPPPFTGAGNAAARGRIRSAARPWSSFRAAAAVAGCGSGDDDDCRGGCVRVRGVRRLAVGPAGIPFFLSSIGWGEPLWWRRGRPGRPAGTFRRPAGGDPRGGCGRRRQSPCWRRRAVHCGGHARGRGGAGRLVPSGTGGRVGTQGGSPLLRRRRCAPPSTLVLRPTLCCRKRGRWRRRRRR